MQIKTIKPSEVNGIVSAPPSKSIAQRAITIASLTNGLSEISNCGNSNDVQSTIRVCKTLGANITIYENKLLTQGGITIPNKSLDCGESGLCLRMFAPIAAAFSEKITLTGCKTLENRPMFAVENAVRTLGAICQTNKGYVPIFVQGPIKNRQIKIDGSHTSQILSGLLIAAPMIENDFTVEVQNLVSKPYIDLTISTMQQFGVTVQNQDYKTFYIPKNQYIPANVSVDGDWSGASFMLVAGAIAGNVTVENLNIYSKQADTAILEAIEKSGATISYGYNYVKISKKELTAFEFDATHTPDLIPPLVALAACCKGKTKIKGTERLIHKESNRLETLCKEFTKMNVKMVPENNTLIIHGSPLKSSNIYSHNDHRIVMACAIAALRADGITTITGCENVKKSYSDFFRDLEKIKNSF